MMAMAEGAKEESLQARSEATSKMLLVVLMNGTCEERSDELKGFLKRDDMVCCSYCRFA